MSWKVTQSTGHPQSRGGGLPTGRGRQLPAHHARRQEAGGKPRGATHPARSCSPGTPKATSNYHIYIIIFPLKATPSWPGGAFGPPGRAGPSAGGACGGGRGRHLGAGRHLPGGPGPGLRHTGLVALLVPEETALGGDPSV